jgi:hypothetical protein
VTVQAGGFLSQSQTGTVAVGQALTEAVRIDLALDPGCNCPSGTLCGATGDCLPPCVSTGEFDWSCPDADQVCVQGYCVSDPCQTLTCAIGFECQNGFCVEQACTNVCCGPGETCAAGLCVTDNCGSGCGAGLICAGGTCVDACAVVTCVTGLLCDYGHCVPQCDVDPSLCTGVGDGGTIPDGGAVPDDGPGTPGGDAAPGSGDSGAHLTQVGGSCGCTTANRGPAPFALLIVTALLAAGLAGRRRR